MALSPEFAASFENWLTRQRWYAGRARELTHVHAAHSVPIADGLDVALFDASYADGSVDRYQVVIRWDDGQNETLVEPSVDARATIGGDGTRVAHDALFDPAAGRRLLALVEAGATVGPLRFVKEPGPALPVDAAVRVMGAEQSNTSVVFGDAAIFKVFRRVTPGINPDIELNRVLGRAGNPHVARLLGAIETELDGEQYALGMLTAFAAGSREGWELATTGTRDDDPDGFTDESRRLGAAVASVHRTLADALGTDRAPFPAATLIERLRSVAATVPQVAERADVIEARYRELDGEQIAVQRMHGDLHLGQVLRTPDTWLLIDFEGEPGQPLPERRRPDSPLRDVAGVLRSYDYAAHQRLLDAGPQPDIGAVTRARAWVDRNCAAFCAGYAAESGTDPSAASGVLAAYELDKAVYEAGYEARFRPTWLPIPMAAIARLVG
jgi:maltokinase